MRVLKRLSLNFIGVVTLFLIFSLGIFAAGLEITGIKSLNSGGSIVLEFSNSTKPVYKSTYDAKNHMLFFEVTNATTKLKGGDFSNDFTNSLQVISTGSGTGFFISLKNNIKYTTTLSEKKITLSFSEATAKKEFTIVIDAGHGGKDPGAVYNGTNEKDIVLKVSNYLKEYLNDDFNVVLTRSTDTYLYLSDRPKKANSIKANMFISIHANASTSSSLEGVETFYFSKTSSPYAAKVAAYENSFADKYGEKTGNISQILGQLEYTKYQEVSANIAKSVTDSMAATLHMKNRGIQGANFAVLRGFGVPKSVAPGILVEIGFMSNRGDYEKIIQSENQRKIAESIANAVKKYFY